MSELRIGSNIAQRLILFATRVLRVIEQLPKNNEFARIVAKQIARCATSGGANYDEARGAESQADFIHKLTSLPRSYARPSRLLANAKTAAWPRNQRAMRNRFSVFSGQLLVAGCS